MEGCWSTDVLLHLVVVSMQVSHQPASFADRLTIKTGSTPSWQHLGKCMHPWQPSSNAGIDTAPFILSSSMFSSTFEKLWKAVDEGDLSRLKSVMGMLSPDRRAALLKQKNANYVVSWSLPTDDARAS